MLGEWLLGLVLTCPPSVPPPWLKGTDGLVQAVAWVESRWDPLAVSPAGARGVMQLMPRTERWLTEWCVHGPPPPAGVFDPAWNVTLGQCYLAHLHRKLGDWTAALVGYNGGHRQYRRYLAGEPLTQETVEYVQRVWRIRLICEGINS